MPCQPTLPYHAAQLVTLDRAADAAALEDYTCSHSMRGVAVELAVAVRPAALVRTVTALLPSDAALPAALLRARPALAASGPDHSLHVMLLPCLCRQQPAGECERPAFPDLAALLARMQRQALCAAQDSQPESATRSCARKRTTCGRPSAWTRHSWSSAGACRLATAAGPARGAGLEPCHAPQHGSGPLCASCWCSHALQSWPVVLTLPSRHPQEAGLHACAPSPVLTSEQAPLPLLRPAQGDRAAGCLFTEEESAMGVLHTEPWPAPGGPLVPAVLWQAPRTKHLPEQPNARARPAPRK